MKTVSGRGEFGVVPASRAASGPSVRESADPPARARQGPTGAVHRADSSTAAAAPTLAAYRETARRESELRALATELGDAGVGRAGSVLERAVARSGRLLVEALARPGSTSFPEARAHSILTLTLFGIPPGAFEIDAAGSLRRDDESGSWRGYLSRSPERGTVELVLERGAPGDPSTRWEATLSRAETWELRRWASRGDWLCGVEYSSAISSVASRTSLSLGLADHRDSPPPGAIEAAWVMARELEPWTSLPDRLPQLTDRELRALHAAGVARLSAPARLSPADEAEILSTLHDRAFELELLERALRAAEALPVEGKAVLTLPDLESAFAESVAELTLALSVARDRGMESGLPDLDAKLRGVLAARVLAPIEAAIDVSGAQWVAEHIALLEELVAELEGHAVPGLLPIDRAKEALARLRRADADPAPEGASGGAELDGGAAPRPDRRALSALQVLAQRATQHRPSASTASAALDDLRRAIGAAYDAIEDRATRRAQAATTTEERLDLKALAEDAACASMELDLHAAGRADPPNRRRLAERALEKSGRAGPTLPGTRPRRLVQIAKDLVGRPT